MIAGVYMFLLMMAKKKSQNMTMNKYVSDLRAAVFVLAS